MVNLVAQHQERRPIELFHGEQRVELGLGFWETLWVLGVDQEDDARDFGKVVAPEPTGLRVATEVEGGEFDLAFRGSVLLVRLGGARRDVRCRWRALQMLEERLVDGVGLRKGVGCSLGWSATAQVSKGLSRIGFAMERATY